MDITADGAMEFFTSRRKVTTKWSMRGRHALPLCPAPQDANCGPHGGRRVLSDVLRLPHPLTVAVATATGTLTGDRANFDGRL